MECSRKMEWIHSIYSLSKLFWNILLCILDRYFWNWWEWAFHSIPFMLNGKFFYRMMELIIPKHSIPKMVNPVTAKSFVNLFFLFPAKNVHEWMGWVELTSFSFYSILSVIPFLVFQIFLIPFIPYIPFNNNQLQPRTFAIGLAFF